MNLYFKSKINDWLIWCIAFYLLISDIIFIISLMESYFALIFGLPLIFFNILFYPIGKNLFISDFLLFDKGIKIKKTFFSWDEIKSISFNNGRYKENSFWVGLKLPALQKLYLLDKKGNEHVALIDIDYAFKPERSRNNMLRINESLHILGKINLISDWAQKR